MASTSALLDTQDRGVDRVHLVSNAPRALVPPDGWNGLDASPNSVNTNKNGRGRRNRRLVEFARIDRTTRAETNVANLRFRFTNPCSRSSEIFVCVREDIQSKRRALLSFHVRRR
eukprot:scaffold332_cov308-Pavlova_lutheri.AAC.13